MTKFEFSRKLRKALSGRVSHTTVNENVAYYENYIDTEIRKGRSEAEVLEELGDPRLIAKTIADTAGEEAGIYAGAEQDEEKGFRRFGKVVRMPFWLGMILLLLILLLIFKVVGIVLSVLLPAAVPILLIYWVIRYFRRR